MYAESAGVVRHCQTKVHSSKMGNAPANTHADWSLSEEGPFGQSGSLSGLDIRRGPKLQNIPNGTRVMKSKLTIQ